MIDRGVKLQSGLPADHPSKWGLCRYDLTCLEEAWSLVYAMKYDARLAVLRGKVKAENKREMLKLHKELSTVQGVIARCLWAGRQYVKNTGQ